MYTCIYAGLLHPVRHKCRCGWPQAWWGQARLCPQNCLASFSWCLRVTEEAWPCLYLWVGLFSLIKISGSYVSLLVFLRRTQKLPVALVGCLGFIPPPERCSMLAISLQAAFPPYSPLTILTKSSWSPKNNTTPVATGENVNTIAVHNILGCLFSVSPWQTGPVDTL